MNDPFGQAQDRPTDGSGAAPRRRPIDWIIIGVAAAATAVSAAWASETINYSYDARGRLVTVNHSGSVNANVVSNYSYDKADNRTNKNVSGAP
jgi:YD repeat-containing protein